MMVIPAIDIRDGKCVRLFQGEFDRQTEYSSDPVAVARSYREAGFTHLHVVDLDGARSGMQKNRQLVGEIIAATDLKVQLGGGIRDALALQGWLDAGIERCVVGSVAVGDPETVKTWFSDFGPGRIVLALDVRLDAERNPLLATHGWTRTSETTLWNCITAFLEVGLKHVLCTDISRDGALSGPNIELYRDLVERFPEIDLQASGGVRHAADLALLRAAGAAAAITGRALLDGRIGESEIASFLPGA